jgi:hypothetical protein
MFLYSLNLKGYINPDDTHVLVITDSELKPNIEAKHKNVKIWEQPCDDVYDAYTLRTKIMNWSQIDDYDKILYLDIDIIIIRPIITLFNLEFDDDEFCVLKESDFKTSTRDADFFDYSKFDADAPAFTSAIILFKNSLKNKQVWGWVQVHIADYKTKYGKLPEYCDQSFIIYQFIINGRYNNHILNKYAVNATYEEDMLNVTDPIITPELIIIHCPCHKSIKLEVMKRYWNLIKPVNIYDDVWTCSDEMRIHIGQLFAGKNYRIAEIGAHKGYSTGQLADVFSHVYAIDNSDEWTNFSRNLNKTKSNITYIKLDLYEDSWANLPDCDVSFIDAIHSYEHCLSDINNSISHFKSLKYIIFDDYGVFTGVKRAVDECVSAGRFEIVKFIGLTEVPSNEGIIHDCHEGVIVRLLPGHLNLV